MSNKKSPAGQLRIVAGNWRSRRLEIAEVPGLRPTSARVRETLFNWLAPTIANSRCLDLCAGTGALGLEALSRGAAETVFVESSSRALAALRRNIATLDASGASVVAGDACDYLQSAATECFDVVFLDPPFSAGLHAQLCRLMTERNWLSQNARIYIELDKSDDDSFLPPDWKVLKDKKAGNVRYLLATT